MIPGTVYRSTFVNHWNLLLSLLRLSRLGREEDKADGSVGEENLSDSRSWEYGAEKFDKDWRVYYVLIGRKNFSTLSEGKLSE